MFITNFKVRPMETIFGTESDKYFESIVNTPTPSGFETEGQKIFASYARNYADEVYSDPLGNVIARKKAEGKPRLMLSAHIDEVGFMVKYIDENGMVYIVPIGGIDLMLLPGLRLAVHHKQNAFLGLIGRKPIHLLNEAERNRFSIEDCWLDVGFTSRKHALLSVAVGDPVTFSTEIRQISDDYLITHSADNKIGSMILMEVMRRISEFTADYDLYFVSTVQEEIGLRGSMPAAAAIEPDMAIVLDATHSTDFPGNNPKLYGDIRLGGGPSFCISPDTHTGIVEELQKIARSKHIPFQMEAHPNASGTEARAIQIVRKGTKTGLVSFPVRYMHSPSEMISITDIKYCADILTAFCQKE